MIDRILDTLITWYVRDWLCIPAPAAHRPQPLPPKPVKRPTIEDRVKFTSQGIPYKEIQPEGCEATAWKILGQGEQKPGSIEEAQIAAAKAKGFAVDTVLKVYRAWQEGNSQSQIAKIAGVSLHTVKAITPCFKK